MFLLIAHFLCNIACDANAQNINTIAGTGAPAYNGDNIPADVAKLNAPKSIDIDSVGNLYIADGFNYRIRKIGPSGIITTVAGTGASGISIVEGAQATAVGISHPESLTIDAAGNIYFLVSFGRRVLKVSSTGIITTIAGNDTYSGFSGDGGTATAALLGGNLHGIASDPVGNVYVSDFSNNRIRKVSTAGIITTFAGNGTPGYSGDGGQATAAAIRPRAIAIDAVTGNVYFSDRDNHVIRKINPSGIITTVAGTGTSGFSGDGGPATAAMISYPEQIRTDVYGNLYICDMINRRVRRVNTAGTITTIAGMGATGFGGDGGPATACMFNAPDGIAITAGCGLNIFVSDYANNRVRQIVYGNSPPAFANGTTQDIVICAGTTVIDSMLIALDTDTGQIETWTSALSPAHGTVSATYSTVSTGGSLLPSGITYTSTPGYFGNDTFAIRVKDCGNMWDTITFYATVLDCPSATAYVNTEKQISIYPNPATNELVVNAAPGAYGTLVIINAIGQQFIQSAIAYPQTLIDVSTLPVGLYYLILQGKRGLITDRFIKGGSQ